MLYFVLYFMEFRTVSVLFPLNLSIKEALKMYSTFPNLKEKVSLDCMYDMKVAVEHGNNCVIALHCTPLICIALHCLDRRL